LLVTEPAGEDKAKPWRWPGQWVRDDTFWRDVASRTLSALFASLFIYVFAVAAGYVSRPDVWRLILVLPLMVAIFVAVVLLANWYMKRHPSPRRPPLTQEAWQAMSGRRRIAMIVYVLVMAMGALSYVVVASR
jgi:hypothetical protein